jgi:hypothetical protein
LGQIVEITVTSKKHQDEMILKSLKNASKLGQFLQGCTQNMAVLQTKTALTI